MDKASEDKKKDDGDFFEPADNAPQETAGVGFTDQDFDDSMSSETSAEPTGEPQVHGGDERRMIDHPSGGSSRGAAEAREDHDPDS